MKRSFRIMSFVIAILLLAVTFSCKKGVLQVIPTLTTTAISSITSTTATSGGLITSDGGSSVTDRGVCWSLSQGPTTSDSKTSDGSGLGTFVSSITGLTPGTLYYVRAYATNSIGTAYGDQLTLNTIAILPTITTNAISAITSTTATSGGNITSDGGAAVTARGVCWSLSQGPTTSDSKTSDGSDLGTFVSSITGLTPGAIYYVRAYATNSIGTAYGDQLTLNTIAILPTITTNAISAITSTTATSGGNITSDGGAAVTARGVCWSTLPSPTILFNSKTTDGSGTGSFASSIIGLSPGTLYYVRAYATNSIGTAYGDQLTLNTIAILPIITTNAISAITSTTATSGGNVTSTGNSPVTFRGVCWSTNQNPTISDSKTTDGAGVGSFTSSITGLSPGRTYYVRAYALNSEGTAYGDEISFITSTTLPTLTTTSVSSITKNSANSGGNILSDGGATVTARGVCWSTNQNPTILDAKTTNGTGTGSFTSSMTNLTLFTTYYVRAYATNSVGTSYGAQVTFNTLNTVPILTTTAVSAITFTTATGGGNITSAGDGLVLFRGVCWSTSPNPTILDSKTTDGDGTGSFTSSIIGLTLGTTYYVRAYATNSAGTGYGSAVSFTTLASTVVDIDGNVYNTVLIGNQFWMKENLKTTKYLNGDLIRTTTPATFNISAESTPKYQWAYDGNESNVATYGRLYTWYAITDYRGVCPAGWHVPTDTEWTILTTFLGGESVAGGMLKETGTTHWLTPNTGATNSSGFTALPGGYRTITVTFSSIGFNCLWWSSTGLTSDQAWHRSMASNKSYVSKSSFPKSGGFSVRCLKDN